MIRLDYRARTKIYVSGSNVVIPAGADRYINEELVKLVRGRVRRDIDGEAAFIPIAGVGQQKLYGWNLDGSDINEPALDAAWAGAIISGSPASRLTAGIPAGVTSIVLERKPLSAAIDATAVQVFDALTLEPVAFTLSGTDNRVVTIAAHAHDVVVKYRFLSEWILMPEMSVKRDLQRVKSTWRQALQERKPLA